MIIYRIFSRGRFYSGNSGATSGSATILLPNSMHRHYPPNLMHPQPHLNPMQPISRTNHTCHANLYQLPMNPQPKNPPPSRLLKNPQQPTADTKPAEEGDSAKYHCPLSDKISSWGTLPKVKDDLESYYWGLSGIVFT